MNSIIIWVIRSEVERKEKMYQEWIGVRMFEGLCTCELTSGRCLVVDVFASAPWKEMENISTLYEVDKLVLRIRFLDVVCSLNVGR